MNYLIYILDFIFGSFLAMALFFAGLKDQVSLKLIGLSETQTPEQAQRKKKKRAFFWRYLRVFVPLNKRLMKKTYQEKTDSSLSALKIGLSALEFFAVKELFMIGLPLGIYLMLGKLRLPYILVIALAGLGFFLPDLWLRQKQRKRKSMIIKVLPGVIDLLSLCVGAGLDFMLAVHWIVEKSRPNPMTEELNTVLQEIKVGKSRREALKDMAHRLNIPDISSFVRTLVQADRIGSPVSETLALISEDSRLRRFRRGERLALQAPMKLLIPLIFCILPTVAIIVAGPVFLQFMQTGLKF